MIFQTTFYGQELNFSIKNGEQLPASGTTNEIFIISATPVGYYAMDSTDTPSATRPDGSPWQSGDIWIDIRSKNSGIFNIIDDTNGIYVYPGSIKQYIDGSWSSVTAYLYTTEWNKISDAGFVVVPNTDFEWTGATTRNEDGTVLFNPKSGNVSGHSSASVDLTGYSTIKVAGKRTDMKTTTLTFSFNLQSRASTSTSYRLSTTSVDVPAQIGDDITEFNVDISSINQVAFLYFTVRGVSTFYNTEFVVNSITLFP